AFEVEGQLRRHGRRPVAGCVVNANPVHLFGAALEARQQGTNDGKLVAEVCEKVECFAGLVGVAVQRNTGSKTLAYIFIAPEIRDSGSGHGLLLRRRTGCAIQLPKFAGFPQSVSMGSGKCPMNRARIALQLTQEPTKLPE